MERDQLLSRRLPEEAHVIPGVGTIRVRGLSHLEALRVSALDGLERSKLILSLGLVEPAINDEEAGRWCRSAPSGEIEAVTNVVAVLSGMATAAAKEAYKSLRGEPGTGIHVLPGGEAGEDGSAAVGGDQ